MVTAEASDPIGSPGKPLTNAQIETKLSVALMTAIGSSFSLLPSKPPEGQLDRGTGNEGGQGFGKVLEIPGETPAASEPEKGAFHPSSAAAGRSPECCRFAGMSNKAPIVIVSINVRITQSIIVQSKATANECVRVTGGGLLISLL